MMPDGSLPRSLISGIGRSGSPTIAKALTYASTPGYVYSRKALYINNHFNRMRTVTGHDFSRAERATISCWALAPASICIQLFAVLQRLKPESVWAILRHD